jgi:hypothetical protein
MGLVAKTGYSNGPRLGSYIARPAIDYTQTTDVLGGVLQQTSFPPQPIPTKPAFHLLVPRTMRISDKKMVNGYLENDSSESIIATMQALGLNYLPHDGVSSKAPRQR